MLQCPAVHTNTVCPPAAAVMVNYIETGTEVEMGPVYPRMEEQNSATAPLLLQELQVLFACPELEM